MKVLVIALLYGIILAIYAAPIDPSSLVGRQEADFVRAPRLAARTAGTLEADVKAVICYLESLLPANSPLIAKIPIVCTTVPSSSSNSVSDPAKKLKNRDLARNPRRNSKRTAESKEVE
jgi:hypothetical protein